MRGVVYVDMLFLINALIGWLLLACAARLAGLPARTWRLFAGGALAGAASLMLLLPPLGQAVLWLAKLGSAALIVLAAFPLRAPRSFARALFWYMALNLALAGVVFAALYYGAAGGIETNNLALYFNVSPLVLIGSVTLVYLAVCACAWVFGRPQEQTLAPFCASVAGGEVRGMALLDTGFRVRDPASGTPAFLLSYPMLRRELPPALAGALDTYFSLGALPCAAGAPRLCLVPARTAAGERALPALRAQSFALFRESGVPLMAVFTPETLGDGSFCAIVNFGAYQQYH